MSALTSINTAARARRIIVTGGAGFIGSALVHYLIKHTVHYVCVIDKLTYAGHMASLEEVRHHPRFQFVQGDISDRDLVHRVFEQFKPDSVMNLAAESHVDRSIEAPEEFLQTNILGTYELLEESRSYLARSGYKMLEAFRFLHVSTDEVFGDLKDGGFFTEQTAYAPSSPYSASKACSDHLVRAWGRTYGLPYLITNCSNNYGPRQFPEKLIPRILFNALAGKPLPVYGNGQQVRDWLFVEDHVRALVCVLESNATNETYTIGGHNEKKNIDVVHTVCDLLQALKPKAHGHYRDLISFVEDRPGHDERYAIDAQKIGRELNWKPKHTFASGIEETICWYLDNEWWVEQVTASETLIDKAA